MAFSSSADAIAVNLLISRRLSNTFSFWVFTEPVPSPSCIPLID